VGEVVKDVVKKYSNLGHSYETIALIYSTAVLIDNEILKSAVKEFEDGDNSVQLLSVSKFPAPIERAMRMDHNILSAVNEEEIVKPSNHLSDAWFETGDFVIYNEKEALTNNKSSKKRGFCIPRWLSIDIDNLDDWETAEWIYKKTYM
jgi:CMP-N-acetylneuraminic acid synthetase